ncbi:MAG: tRNA uridine-5-carboxymethylaminomethyl(34) synthesis GTPase MnmE [Muribaculum sp.]|nr:tRNA uridine-5-carboxymethylaminomethyl(34) synthesis GTPase MnmE [Muribaculum sp.]
MNYELTDTIVALATPHGKGALAIVRISGPDAINIADSVWQGKSLLSCKSHTVHLGYIKDEAGQILDQAVATIFIAPNTFTGENIVEFSLHGSQWIVREVINLIIRKGARGAEPGEFSRRAYMNGRMDLASAEGVADLIASSSKASHTLAMKQTRGAFSREFNALRDKLIQLASLLELELDFSEEDVEFADRTALLNIANELISKIDRLTKSYSAGRAFKEGVPVVIAGVPNVGKSTLLNSLLQEEKAIVSDIPGTTRDVIEDTCEIEGILFRFIDTAGLRQSSDQIESIGIDLARKRLSQASIILWLIDPYIPVRPQISEMKSAIESLQPDQQIIPIITKVLAKDIPDTLIDDIIGQLQNELQSRDKTSSDLENSHNNKGKILKISTVENLGIDILCDTLRDAATAEYNPERELILTNARHYGDLLKAGESLRRAVSQIENGLSADIIAMDVRQAISALTSLTGSIATPDILNSIFSSFCIGK